MLRQLPGPQIELILLPVNRLRVVRNAEADKSLSRCSVWPAGRPAYDNHSACDPASSAGTRLVEVCPSTGAIPSGKHRSRRRQQMAARKPVSQQQRARPSAAFPDSSHDFLPCFSAFPLCPRIEMLIRIRSSSAAGTPLFRPDSTRPHLACCRSHQRSPQMTVTHSLPYRSSSHRTTGKSLPRQPGESTRLREHN